MKRYPVIGPEQLSPFFPAFFAGRSAESSTSQIPYGGKYTGADLEPKGYKAQLWDILLGDGTACASENGEDYKHPRKQSS